MNWIWAVAVSVVIAGLIATATKPKPRHHIYWCYLAVHEQWQGYRLTHTMSLPCMYRTNNPVDV